MPSSTVVPAPTVIPGPHCDSLPAPSFPRKRESTGCATRMPAASQEALSFRVRQELPMAPRPLKSMKMDYFPGNDESGTATIIGMVAGQTSLGKVADIQGGKRQYLGHLFHVADTAELVGDVLGLRAAAGSVQQGRAHRQPRGGRYRRRCRSREAPFPRRRVPSPLPYGTARNTQSRMYSSLGRSKGSITTVNTRCLGSGGISISYWNSGSLSL